MGNAVTPVLPLLNDLTVLHSSSNGRVGLGLEILPAPFVRRLVLKLVATRSDSEKRRK